MTESWASGAAYEPFMGRWSRLVARRFVAWLDAPPLARWMELGCGTGALTQAVLEVASPERVTACDRSAAYAAYARGHTTAEQVRFAVADAMWLPLRPGAADVAVSGLLLNFLPDPRGAVDQMAHAVSAGGTVAAYVWDYAEGMELLRRFWDAAAALDPAAASLDEGRRFPLCAPAELVRLWEDAGLDEVRCSSLEVSGELAGFDDYWRPFLGGQGPAPGYVASLDADRRDALQQRLQASLPVDRDGRIRLKARAWAVRGRRTR